MPVNFSYFIYLYCISFIVLSMLGFESTCLVTISFDLNKLFYTFWKGVGCDECWILYASYFDPDLCYYWPV